MIEEEQASEGANMIKKDLTVKQDTNDGGIQHNISFNKIPDLPLERRQSCDIQNVQSN